MTRPYSRLNLVLEYRVHKKSGYNYGYIQGFVTENGMDDRGGEIP